MFQRQLEQFAGELSGEAARDLAARISQWHRIQASPMYREAATWLHTTLAGWGLPGELEAFPTGEGLQVWGEPLFDEWRCDEGWLDLLRGDGSRRRLADYRAVPLALMPRSASVDAELELVVVEGGEHLDDYAGLDVRGKLVLTRSMPMRVHPVAVEELGAAGLLFDGMRTIPTICPPGDLPDAIQYASFWWWGGETRVFGFALSPRAGAELRRNYARAQRAGMPLRLHARVRSSFGPGTIEAVSARIPGETDEEVLLTAHLCHPAPCANDNASGAAAAMEIARALHAMVETGRLPRPRRSIRLLWIPEMTGTYLYLAAHEERISRTVAGLNLDMVGADQATTGAVSLVVHPSDAAPAFVGDLLEALRDQTHAPAHTAHGRAEPALHRFGSTPFSNGSDHYILADPSVGIPTPMIIEWPDRFYHTTADTIEHVSAATLHRNMTLAATYIWAVANAGPAEAAWLAREMQSRFVARLARELQSAATAALGGARPLGAPWDERLAFRLDRHAAALTSLRRLDPAFDPAPLARAAAAQAELLWHNVADVLTPWHLAERPLLEPAAAALVPRRRVRGPITPGPHLTRLAPAERAALLDEFGAYRALAGLTADIALAWADGSRTLGTILDHVELETDTRQPTALLAYFQLLERLGFVELS